MGIKGNDEREGHGLEGAQRSDSEHGSKSGLNLCPHNQLCNLLSLCLIFSFVKWD